VSVRRQIAWALLAPATRTAARVARLKCRLPAGRRRAGIVHVIGDSHVALFSGRDAMTAAWPRRSVDTLPGFRTYRLGSVLAYRLSDWGTTTHGREKLLLLLAYGAPPPKARVLLCFGEIDCRYHLLRQAERTGRPIDDVVAECVDRYATVVREVLRMGFRTAVWGVVPANSVEPREGDPEYPYWGTAAQRNEVASVFNRMLAETLAPDGVPVATVSEVLSGGTAAPLDERYFMDDVHLSQEARTAAVQAVETAFEEVARRSSP